MPRGDKSKYTEKLEQGYEDRGVPEHEAEKRAWATVNKMDGGGELSGAGRGKPVNKAPARKGRKRAAQHRPLALQNPNPPLAARQRKYAKETDQPPDSGHVKPWTQTS